MRQLQSNAVAGAQNMAGIAAQLFNAKRRQHTAMLGERAALQRAMATAYSQGGPHVNPAVKKLREGINNLTMPGAFDIKPDGFPVANLNRQGRDQRVLQPPQPATAQSGLPPLKSAGGQAQAQKQTLAQKLAQAGARNNKRKP